MERLEDQIAWYDRKSGACQRAYKRLKYGEIVAAALVPLLSGAQFLPVFAGIAAFPLLVGLAGVVIVVLESLQQINQYHANWIQYRATAEALKHEKHLFMAGAGPYANREQPIQLLAVRIEELISREHAKWLDDRRRAASGKEE